MISLVSEQIKTFLDFVDECRSMHDIAYNNMKQEDARLQDLLHAIEFESNSKERSKICTKLHRSRTERRRNKDIVEETEEIVKFFQDPQHKKTLEQLKQLLGKVRKVEKYHREREYHQRVKEE